MTSKRKTTGTLLRRVCDVALQGALHIARTVRRDQRGFTLIEMIVIFGIISVLSVLVVANTRVGNQSQEVRDAAAKYVTAVRQAEASSISGQIIPEPTPSTNRTPRRSYGVCTVMRTDIAGNCVRPGASAKPDAYQIYARVSAPAPDNCQPPPNSCAWPTAPDIIASYPLPRNVVFSKPVYVDFLAPIGTMLTNGTTTTLNGPNALVMYNTNVAVGDTTTGKAGQKLIILNPLAGSSYVQ